MNRVIGDRQGRRRDTDLKMKKVLVCIPEDILKESYEQIKALSKEFVFLNFSHYVTCSLIRMKKHLNEEYASQIVKRKLKRRQT